ncbi:hypothetical protein L6255_00015 [Candidatus Parcubacteria bacterium]|nr:hypothetical protein [Patescibacteria group bacterium]MBU4380744.1 hypothetical protein [Patescibacteria group bacterium]MCG2688826.1 hypothetical protein [Candidatus Parcubacteria bacterium]
MRSLKNKKINFYLVFSFVIAVGSFIFGAFFINSSSEESSEYARFLVRRNSLLTENQILRNKTAKYSALSNIKKMATDFGMIDSITR